MPAGKSIKKKLPPTNKCAICKGACCRYITMQMPTPVTIEEFDGLYWQISHRDIVIFKDSDGWNLLLATPCLNLQKNGRCAIYETRPNVCREHSADECEWNNSIADNAKLYFKSAQELDAYCSKRFKSWKRRFKE